MKYSKRGVKGKIAAFSHSRSNGQGDMRCLFELREFETLFSNGHVSAGMPKSRE